MRIVRTVGLCLAAACSAERLSAPTVEPLPAAAPAQIHIHSENRIPFPYLFVLDGSSYLYPGDSARLAEINAADIESIEVIKGSGESQLCKAIGCTIVVIVTTKRHEARRSPQ
jgi:hypothetical protein